MREHNENRSTNKTEKEMCAYASPDSALSSALSRSASTMANLRATYWGRGNEEARIKRSIEEEVKEIWSKMEDRIDNGQKKNALE